MELIEREAAIAKVEPDEYYHSNEVKAMLEDLPTIDAAPVVHGRWTFGGDGIIQCSLCEMTYPSQGAFKKAFYPMHYCPNCGARMDGGEEHEAR